MRTFNSVLVANRGEIACRVIATAKAEGYRTVAVYSEADRHAPHVSLADDAVCIGPGPVNESYLVVENILSAAAEAGAGAIHPGYGFLSENADFARACNDAGICFIGPSADAIHLMGNKAEAKRRMQEAGVPCVPGYEGEDQTDDNLALKGREIGMPLMVKAAAGGGGRGMRLVESDDQLGNAIALARAEAESAFGSGELILEKAIVRPRHVEIQVFGDSHGNIIHLGERDCSVQRRHQKVVEEAPCPVMTSALRTAMGAAAVAAAESIGYCGAGTVEFLLDESGEFYFLEMNTRLQVEHPVTELVTGLDLVALQLRVAQGEAINIAQEDVTLTGHAIEVRLYTEDPAQDFLPTSGPIDLWAPATGEGIRVDDGIVSGQVISPFYDPMVAKIIAYGDDRESARLRLIDALRASHLFGPKHNGEFLIACLEKDSFASGTATTAFIAEEFFNDEPSDTAMGTRTATLGECAMAAVLEHSIENIAAHSASVIVSSELMGWSSAGDLVARKRYTHNEHTYDLTCISVSDSAYTVTDGQTDVSVKLLSLEGNSAQLDVDGKKYLVGYQLSRAGLAYLNCAGRTHRFEDEIQRDGEQLLGSGGGSVIAPMHGLLLEIRVEEGDEVEAGQTLAVLEAMKMHYEIMAEADGKVESIIASAGVQVAADDLILEIDVASE